MKTPYIILLIISVITACKEEKKTQTIDDKSIVIDTIISPKSIEKTNDPTKFEEEYIEDEYIEDEEFMPPIENDSYFGIVIGKQISDNKNVLKPGELKTGEGVFDVHYIMYKADTLGYVFGSNIIESIHISDTRGATNNGIRVGTTFDYLKKILKKPEVHGSEIESRVHVFNQNHMYRLDYYSMEYNLDYLEIPDTVVVKEIIITK